MLRSRIISTFVLIPVVIYLLFFSSKIQFSLLLFTMCAISAWEWGKLMNFSFKIYCIWMCMMCSLLYITMTVIISNYSYLDHYWFILFIFFSFIMVWWMFMFCIVVFYPYFSIYWDKFNILRFLFGIFMILPFFLGVLILYGFDFFHHNINGKWWLLYILVLVWINDSSAYIIGRTIGKYKLLQCVSPNKTWEGCVGGILTSTGIAWLLCHYIMENIDYNCLYIIFICFIGTIFFSIIGDLTESMFKRASGIKDVSNLVPGHGGMLDRIDSLLAAVPSFIVFLLLFTHINIIST
ncbi:phosphatidate cytidylyltransferase [Candidatus Blochmanniella vafra str. BVAF]|uniref:Phosphatidate cytidylyltransferase n=1 Tax=Blochmanniella vafra (strain BVAF) TaxID=859654 RepID=E8Q6T1_BLOVB|nr:phosphatidate cytidylyltransferase [Candidatus Blochmannia vafer]ADV33678.1 phosphatidate cytidylyltransferase [Candidatus Blochmannia vafer str. BVAF]